MQTIEQIRAAHAEQRGSEFHAVGRFVVASYATKEGRGGRFGVLDLRDGSGMLTARCFDQNQLDALASAKALDVTLRISEFNGQMSAVLQSFTATELEREELLRMAGLDLEVHAQRVETITGWLAECDGTHYGEVLRAIFTDECWDQFCLAPAAVRMHHAEPGGLVRHIVEVGSAGLAMLDSQNIAYDRPYFLAGVLLHDIGKVDTYTGPPTIEYTAHGRLGEHQIWSTFRLAKACAQVSSPRSVEAKLVHIIEQAHGAFRHAEWQDPLGPEAKALAAADFFSSRLGVTDKERQAQDALDRLLATDAEAQASLFESL